MAEDNIKSWVVSWILISLFSISIMSFVVLFPIYQGNSDIYENDSRINDTLQELKATVTTSENLANANTNLTSDYDPTTSQSGADITQKGQSNNMIIIVQNTFGVLKIFAYYLLADVGIFLMSVLGIIILLISLYYGLKNIRTGT